MNFPRILNSDVSAVLSYMSHAAAVSIEGAGLSYPDENETGNSSTAVSEPLKKLHPDLPLNFINHKKLKEEYSDRRAAIRTGEIEPYVNIILPSARVL